MRFNPTVSIYWLWLVLIGFVLAVVPSVPFSGGNGEVMSFYVMSLYGVALRGYADPFSSVDNRWILLHTVVSVALAIVVALVYPPCSEPQQTECPPHSKAFTLNWLLLAIATLSCAIGVLIAFGTTYILYLVVLIIVAGWIATLLLTAAWLRFCGTTKTGRAVES